MKENKMVQIRSVKAGDEDTLAHIHIESWRAAFHAIVTEEILSQRTDFEKVSAAYRKLISDQTFYGYLLEVDGSPQCMAWWGNARAPEPAEHGELICIHSLQEHWRKGYGRILMKHLLADAKKAGFTKLVLWVFRENERAIRFYQAMGFTASGRTKASFGAVEEMYQIEL